MASELEELRALVRNRHKAATRKVSRLKSSKGANVAGTKMDVRRDPKNIKRYTTKQLKTYLGELNTFVDRKTQYVGDYKGRPLAGDKWSRYKSLETQFNEKRVAMFNKVKDVYLPSSKMTIAERMAKVTPDHPTAGNPSTKNPNIKTDRISRGVKTQKGLDRLIKDMQKRLDKDFEKRELKGAKKEYGQIMEVVNDKQILDAVKDLSEEQFRTLWFYTNFATALSSIYEIVSATGRGDGKEWHAQISDDSLGEARQLVQDAKNYRFSG